MRKFLGLLALLAAAGASPARAEWREARTDHFVLTIDSSEEEARDFATRLERFDAALRLLYGVQDSADQRARPIMIYALREEPFMFACRCPGTLGKYVPRVEGSYIFSMHAPAADRKAKIGSWSSQALLLHEYSHHFMYSHFPVAYPFWFSEGFAEFNANTSFEPDGSLIIGYPANYRAEGVANGISMKKLLDPQQYGFVDNPDVIYARGWLLTHYLLLDKNRSAMLANYISALNAGKSVDEANKAFGDVGALDGKLTTYIRKGSLPAVVLTPQQVPIGEVRLRTLSPGEAAVMPAQIRSASGVDPATTALEVVALARRLAAPFPNDPAAQNELAEAEYDARNFALAEAAADRALAADPRSVHALIYKGMAQLEQAKKDKVADPAKWRAIRAWFLAANKVDTEYPWPLQLYYESFAAAGQAPTKNAQDGLVYAYALAPFDFGLRMAAGEVLLRQGKAQAARVAFEPIAFGPHGSSITKFASEVLAALDAKGAEGALAVIAADREKTRKAAEDAKAGKKP